MRSPQALLTVEQMGQADEAAIRAGVPSLTLMENAGSAVALALTARWQPVPTLIMCGPGNNGGDGFVVARRLLQMGWPVRVALLGTKEALKGDAAAMAAKWTGPIVPLEPSSVRGMGLVVDSLFGAGLARPLEGAAKATVEAVRAAGLPVVAVDLPSGVDGDTGQVTGAAIKAELTVTFYRKKPGHLLLPGRTLCGDVEVQNIGIPKPVLDEIGPDLFENAPELWLPRFPWPAADANKYSRGSALVLGGERMTGAARLAARAALRIGAGLVTVACTPESFPVYAAADAGLLLAPLEQGRRFADLMADERISALLLGPGAGLDEVLKGRVLAAVESGRPTVLDADALTVFADSPQSLFGSLHGHCLLTPHEGEFARLFGKGPGGRLERARAAAAESGATVLLKGPDTVIAAPDGRAAINATGTPWLATAGAGDVLAGLALGLMAGGMDAFNAGCAAAWIHGRAAQAFGPGLVAADIESMVPGILADLGTAY